MDRRPPGTLKLQGSAGIGLPGRDIQRPLGGQLASVRCLRPTAPGCRRNPIDVGSTGFPPYLGSEGSWARGPRVSAVTFPGKTRDFRVRVARLRVSRLRTSARQTPGISKVGSQPSLSLLVCNLCEHSEKCHLHGEWSPKRPNALGSASAVCAYRHFLLSPFQRTCCVSDVCLSPAPVSLNPPG